MNRLTRWLPTALAAAGLLLALAGVLAGRSGGAGGGPAAVADALTRGNRLVRGGELEAALDAYAAGWHGGGSGPGAATLAYNLGTTHQRLGRLPEAVLWYRRATAAAPPPADPWIDENLELARAELAAARFPPPGLAGLLAAHPLLTMATAVGLAWLALALFLARRRLSRSLPETAAEWAWTAPAALAFAAWATVFALAAWGPHPAVLLAPCGPELAAGSELWVTPAGDDGWSVAGGPQGRVCPRAAVGLVD